jgi:hyaluronan synthase
MKENKIKGITLIPLALVVSILIFFILIIKAYTFAGMNLIYPYTIFITTFMLSRVCGSFFYNSPSTKIDYHYNPKVTFIIPCKNEEKVIFHTISKCLEVDYPKNKVQVIAINDGSTDKTLKEMTRAKNIYKNRNLKVINWKINKGKREGMLCGFKNAKGEIVIQLDSDSYPDKNALRHLVSPFKNKKIASVVGHTDPANKNENLITKMQTAYYFMSFRGLKATESIFDMVFCCSGCCSAYRKKYVLPILDKWNSETFMGKKYTYGDDRALTNQMLKKGYKTVYDSEAQAYTVVPNTLRQFLKQQVRWKKGWFINSIKASKFVMKKNKFVSLTYFFPLILLTLLTPFIAFKALVVNPIFLGISPLFYVVGILLVSSIFYVHYKIYDGGNYGKYMFLWRVLNMTLLSYLIIYALYDLRNLSWGTR